MRPATTCIFDNTEQDAFAIAQEHFQAGQFREALASFETALARYQEQGDRLRAGDTLDRIAATRVQLSQYAQALALYQQALALRRELGDLPGLGVTLAGLADVYERLGRYEQADGISQINCAIVGVGSPNSQPIIGTAIDWVEGAATSSLSNWVFIL